MKTNSVKFEHSVIPDLKSFFEARVKTGTILVEDDKCHRAFLIISVAKFYSSHLEAYFINLESTELRLGTFAYASFNIATSMDFTIANKP